MLRSTLIAAALAVAACPAAAKLAPGVQAPDFSAPAYLAGAPFTYKLADNLKKGPVVLYFFPSAYTAGCNLEARLFSEAVDEFHALGATVIGVTSGKTERLAEFSKDTKSCGGKFPVAADPGAAIAKRYDAPLSMKGMAMPGLSGRVSYVIAPNGKVIHAYENLDANDHVNQTLSAVKAWKAGKLK
ncbi:peroxiredoxin [Phenylobacterium sp.]|uniref:peroxiredoxin n=1 Tax=Phenylobacterium sp. TaxID=1871053 RepID=UPI0025E891C8|nr:peroxiredoxin [Phenylobacterium sp.]MCA3716557.1 peroxiredoxin [Phenylobacterium sp.]